MSTSRTKPEAVGPQSTSGSRSDGPVTATNVLSFAALARKRRSPERVAIAPKPEDIDPGPGAA